ncbi:MAG TPA: glycosyltransferase family 39 protein [Thermoanaerobaculia bacterium]
MKLNSSAAAWIVCAAALLSFLALAIGDIVATSPTTDEGVHLAAGYAYLAGGHYQLNPEHPPLLKKLAALPLLAMKPWGFARPEADEATVVADAQLAYGKLQEALRTPGALAQWDVQHYFFWGLRDRWFGKPTTEALPRDAFVNPAEAMFTRARMTMLLVGVAMIVLVFFWSRALWGMWGAALSVLLIAFDPNVIAHSGLVTTDAGVAMLMFGALFFFWRVRERFSIANVTGFALFFALAQVAKFSAVLLLPILLVVLLQKRRKELAMALGAAAIATVAVIWASYGFARHEGTDLRGVIEDWYATEALLPAYPDGPPDAEVTRARRTTRIGFAGRTILRVNDWKLLPEPYLYGLAAVRRSAIVRESYLDGRFAMTGFGSYFPLAFLYKTTIPALLLIALAFLAVRKSKTTALPFLLWPVTLYFLISINSNLNLGHRHILPVYPFLYVLCGALALTWKKRTLGLAAIAIVLTAVVVPLPKPAPLLGRHLSYMNAFAGGPWNGHEHLLDSNYVWGQDLERLGEWLAKNNVREPINLVYSSMAEPRYYGIRYYNLQWGYWSEPQMPPDLAVTPGYLAIDADRLHGLGMEPAQRSFWPQFLARHRAKEVGRAGYSIFIYRIE